jgi:hypothetical protein
MATLASLLISIGVKVDGALKSEQVVKKLQGTTKAMGRDAKEATDQAQTGFRRLGSTIRNMATRARASIKGLIDRMGGLKTIALGAVAAISGAAIGVFHFVDSQTKAIDSTNKLSASLGIGIEELQRLQFAASQSGVSNEALALSMKTLNRNLLDAQQGGGKKFVEALEQINLNVAHLEGLSRTQQIGIIGDALNNVSNDAERSALAAEIFGSRAGPELATLLREGTEGIQRLADSTQGVFTQEDADRATEFQDRMGELRNQLGAISNELLAALLPNVIDMVMAFQGWIRENDTFIKQDLPVFLQKLAKDIGVIVDVVVTMISWVAKATKAWQDFKDSLGIVGDAIGVLIDVIEFAFSPLTKLIGLVSSLSSEFDIAGSMALKFGNNVEEGVRQAMTQVKAAAERERRETMAAWQAANPDFVPSGPAPGSGGAAPAKPKAKGGGGGGGGGRAKKDTAPAAKKAPADKPLSAITLQQALTALQQGHLETMNQNLRDMGTSTPGAKSIQPTVAMDVTINTNNFDIEQHISSTDPVAAGRESVAEFKRAWHETLQRTGLSIPGMTVR